MRLKYKESLFNVYNFLIGNVHFCSSKPLNFACHIIALFFFLITDTMTLC